MSVYHSLLEIKKFRESQAETEVRHRRLLLAEARRMVEQLERQLEEYKDWAVRHELELYADICTRLVRLREIEELHFAVGDLRNHERNLEQGVVDADQRRHAAAEEVDTAVEVLTQAGRQTNKFKELARIYSEEARREQERQEEMEMEEFRSPDGRDDEWESANDDASAIH